MILMTLFRKLYQMNIAIISKLNVDDKVNITNMPKNLSYDESKYSTGQGR